MAFESQMAEASFGSLNSTQGSNPKANGKHTFDLG